MASKDNDVEFIFQKLVEESKFYFLGWYCAEISLYIRSMANSFSVCIHSRLSKVTNAIIMEAYHSTYSSISYKRSVVTIDYNLVKRRISKFNN